MNFRSLLVGAAACILLADCTATQTTATNKTPRTDNPAATDNPATTTDAPTHHVMTLSWPRGCKDERSDVVVVVDSTEYRFPAFRDHIAIRVSSGKHSVVQYHGNYEVWRWPEITAEHDVFLALRCYGQ